MKLFFFALLALLFLQLNNCVDFPPKSVAILVAGSSSYWNYRHQADVAHAYKNLRKHGLSEDNIIVMIVDDVARDEYNIAYNTLFNRPYGENYYTKFHVDYNNFDVTPETFYAILKGDEADLRYKGNGKYFKLNPQDNVFIYFTDHGATGLFAFPFGYDALYADELSKALKNLKKKCNKVFVFMEACESGSMFQGYLDDVDGILAMTASDPYESSYAYYYAPYLDAYLGDESSINFLEYMEKADPYVTTVNDLYRVVKTETKLSHVQVYGDLSILDMPVGEFFGWRQEYLFSSSDNSKKNSESYEPLYDAPNAIESKYVQRTLAKEKLSKDPKHRESLLLLENERKIEQVFKKIEDAYPAIFKVEKQKTLSNGPVFTGNTKTCYIESIEYFNTNCFSANKYNLVYSFYNKLYTLCANDILSTDILSTIYEACSSDNKQ